MLNKVLKTLNKYSMIQNGDKICVALSGGADSVALLHLLHRLKADFNIELSAVHINHSLRGEESDRDEEFVTRLCQRMNVTLKVEKIDVKALADKNNESIELAARKARYEVFSGLDGTKIATAHTATDNAETVLINLTRGTSLKGLCGIPAVRDNIIRPLINCTRQEIEEYCAAENLSFVTDSSNLSDDYTRNQIRHNVTPHLRNINMAFDRTVRRSCENVAYDADFLFGFCDELYSKHRKDNSLILPRDMHRALTSRLVFRLISDVTGASADSLHISEICDAIGTRKRVELFSGFSAVVNGNKISVLNDDNSVCKEYSLTQKIISREEFDKKCKINNLLLKSAVDYDKICGVVSIRTRNPGDGIKLPGRNGTKNLRKLYNELKIPVSDRENNPVAADDSGVIWVFGVGASERVSINKNTENVLLFECEIK